MEALVWILVAVAILAVIFAVYWVTAGRAKRVEQQRERAAEHRQEAAAAAHRAGQAEVQAQRAAREAEVERERALELQDKAEKVDPDRR